MEYRKIKDTELSLSVLGTGCWAFGGGDYWGEQEQNDVNEVVHASVANGINYFDTAEVYNEGRSESALGEALKGIPRDQVIIGSKLSPSNAYAGILRKHCEASLKRLQTDHLDIYMIHWPIHPHSIRHFTNDEGIVKKPPAVDEAFEALLDLQQQGKIRYIGVSNYSYRRLKEDIPANARVAVNELPYNLLCRAIEYDTLPYCRKKGIGVIGYMSLLQGLLAKLYTDIDNIPEQRKRTRHFNCTRTKLCRHGEEGFEKETLDTLLAIEAIARDCGLKMSALATRWTLASGITCSLVGARNAVQLEQNVEALDAKIDDAVFQLLNKVTDVLKEKMGNHFDYYESKENNRTL